MRYMFNWKCCALSWLIYLVLFWTGATLMLSCPLSAYHVALKVLHLFYLLIYPKSGELVAWEQPHAVDFTPTFPTPFVYLVADRTCWTSCFSGSTLLQIGLMCLLWFKAFMSPVSGFYAIFAGFFVLLNLLFKDLNTLISYQLLI